MIKDRIEELKRLIKEADYNYYMLDDPKISDQEYDRYMQELIKLEEDNPNLITADSPTKIVGGGILDKLNKVKHKTSMLSLSNVFNEEEVRNFAEKIKKQFNDSYVCEPKIDGMAISLIYEHGKLVRAITRGDGEEGEDVTHNVITIKSVPKNINKDINLEVRGEIYMSKKVFENLNIEREKEGLDLFANPRNAAAGSIRQLDSKVARKRQLDCFVYSLTEASIYDLKTHYDSLMFLKQLGFAINEKIKKVNNINEVIKYINYLEKNKKELEYEIDGVVIKLNTIEYQNKMGLTSKYPKWAVAYKFKAEEAITQLLDIHYTVGRTGKITPNAVLSPVRIDGTVVRRASLHNRNNIIEKNIRINDMVIVRKAGDIIPEVVKALLERRKKPSKQYKMIEKCPICNSLLVQKGELDYCINEQCGAREQERLIHFISRGGMNIDGFGERIIEDLYNIGILKKISDFYKLSNYKEEIINLEGFGAKRINNLLLNIELSKNNSFERLLFGLGIDRIGTRASLLLAKEYKNIDNIISAKYDDLIKIEGIGDIIANNIISYFNNKENINLIEELKHFNVNMNYLFSEENKNEKIFNKTFVITGTLNNYKRNELKLLIESKGGIVLNNLSNNTDLLIVGNKPGSKYKKALELNIEICDETQLTELLK